MNMMTNTHHQFNLLSCCSVWAWCKPGINSWLRAEPTFPGKEENPPEKFLEDPKKVIKNSEKLIFYLLGDQKGVKLHPKNSRSFLHRKAF